MEKFNRQKHWENIYQTKAFENVSWYQDKPITSLNFLEQYNIPKSAKIIDIGGGDSFFVDNLLKLNYEDITVLDISASAIERAKKRLGEKAKQVNWIVADASNFTPERQYDFWHDRAAFHFLTDEKDIDSYIKTARNHLSKEGILSIGTFSDKGPKKCSGIEVQQYSENSMTSRLEQSFEKINCIHVNHQTPFDTVQNFIFCTFKKSTSI